MKLNALRSLSRRSLAEGAVLGGVAGFLLWELGVLDASGIAGAEDTVAIGTGVGLILGASRREAIALWLDAAMLAAYVPARRSSRIDPIVAMREE